MLYQIFCKGIYRNGSTWSILHKLHTTETLCCRKIRQINDSRIGRIFRLKYRSALLQWWLLVNDLYQSVDGSVGKTKFSLFQIWITDEYVLLWLSHKDFLTLIISMVRLGDAFKKHFARLLKVQILQVAGTVMYDCFDTSSMPTWFGESLLWSFPAEWINFVQRFLTKVILDLHIVSLFSNIRFSIKWSIVWSQNFTNV